jgi:hypothetical protein
MKLLNQFFIPDEAAAGFIDQTSEQLYIVRQYRTVPVREGRSPGVRALFLPRLSTREDGYFSIEPLLFGYLASGRVYGFDEAQVRRELDYHGVPAADQPFVLQALARAGVISYMTPNRELRLFKIDIHDGSLTTRVLQAARR